MHSTKASKTPGTPKQKELDEHGNIIKKRREKRPSKPMEETTIYYRLCKKEEQADLQQAGYPSPENSHMAEGEDGDEENKGEDGDQGRLSKGEFQMPEVRQVWSPGEVSPLPPWPGPAGGRAGRPRRAAAAGGVGADRPLLWRRRP